MKAQYVGDVGDFGKVLILKHLAGVGFRLGVNWLLTANDEKADGKHRDYVTYKGEHCLCNCDPSIFTEIIPLAREEKPHRKIAQLEQIIRGICEQSLFYSEPIVSGPTRAWSDRKAFAELTSAELIFFDPDNGIDLENRTSEKHVYIGNLREYWIRGQSLLIYHHLHRSDSHSTQIETLTKVLEKSMNGSEVLPYRLCRGTCRVYFLCVQPTHLERLSGKERIESIAPLQVPKRKWVRIDRCRLDHSITQSHLR